MSSYGFAEDWRPGGTRLASVERQFDAVTMGTLMAAGVRRGMRCWEVGVGRGSVMCWLADVVGDAGRVWATDLDLSALPGQLPECVEAQVHDVTVDPTPLREFDLVHARLVLEHLADPSAALTRLATALAPGGCLVVEDAVGLKFASDPPTEALAVLVPSWERAAREIGWRPLYGGRVLDDLLAAGLTQVRARTHCYHAPGGEDWFAARRGLARLREAILELGVQSGVIEEVDHALADPQRIITGSPVITAWGYSP